jgi:general secretion pathway protein A
VSQFGKPLSSAVSANSASSLLTYEPYYGLREKAFSLSADPRFLYKSPSHASTFDNLRAGIRRREGLIVLTGDIGTGKTTLCRAVLQSLDRKTFSTFVPDPFLSREDLLKMLLVDFGVVSLDDLKSGRLAGASRPDLSYPLYDFLKSLVPLQAFAVLVIDEAQNLPVSLLEEIRILSDLEAPEKLLQVVLVGQSELQDKLKLFEMRQVDQRVSVRCDLQPLSCDVVASYIAYRLDVAGAGRGRVGFTDAAAAEVCRVSKGVPRVVNLICDRALHHGYLERSPRIYPPHVVRAVADLGLRKVEDPEPPSTEPTPAPPLIIENVATIDAPPIPVAEDPASEGLFAFQAETAFQAEIPFQGETPEPASVDDPKSSRWHVKFSQTTAIVIVAVASVGFLATFSYLRRGGSAQAGDLPPLPAAPRAAIDRSVNFLPMHIAASMAMAENPALYSIDVAAFRGELRGTDLVNQLVAAGFKAHLDEAQFTSGRMYVVRIGPYILQADADTDLTQVRQLPGLADARLSTLLPSAAQ